MVDGMESDKLIGSLLGGPTAERIWFIVIHKSKLQNLNAHGLDRNPSLLEEDLTNARWHGSNYMWSRSMMTCFILFGMDRGKIERRLKKRLDWILLMTT